MSSEVMEMVYRIEREKEGERRSLSVIVPCELCLSTSRSLAGDQQ